MKRCRNCGQAHEDADVKFCKACGKPFANSAATGDVQASPLLDHESSDMSAFSCYIDAFKKYVKFSGRATRKQFWTFVLFNTLIVFAILIMSGIFYGLAESLYSSRNITLSTAKTLVRISDIFDVLYYLFALATIIPHLALTWRRMHDINRSGAWYFIILVPIVGIFWFIYLCCQRGDDEENDFGVPFHQEDNSFEQSTATYIPNSTVNAVKTNSSKCAKIIRVLEDRVSIGANDGSFFDINIKELDFQPVVGDVVYVFKNGDAKIVTKNELF